MLCSCSEHSMQREQIKNIFGDNAFLSALSAARSALLRGINARQVCPRQNWRWQRRIQGTGGQPRGCPPVPWIRRCHRQFCLGQTCLALIPLNKAERAADKADKNALSPKMFLICSRCMLCSEHEQSILSCPQAPAGHGALRAGGCDFSFS